MTRRRLRLHYSSSEEEDANQQPQPQSQPPSQLHPRQLEFEEEEDDDIEVELLESTLNLETVTLNTPYPNPNPNPNSNPNPNPTVPVQLEISDDDYMDVSDNLSPPAAPPPATDQSFQSSNSTGTSTNSVESSDCPITAFLGRLGLRLRREWFDSCVAGLKRSVQGFGNLDVAAKAKLCFEQFSYSDMNYSGAGILPENVHNMHLADLPGPFILQVDEIVNISCPLKGRYQSAASGLKRCLKLSMTDGVQRVFGMEYRPIKDLEILAPAGLKVAICNVNIRRGIIMLIPEVFEVLGGLVEDLEAARQRLVCEVSKPPRGKRTRTGVALPLATRATLAAWPPDSVSVPGNANSPLSQAAAPLQVAEQGRASGISTSERTTEEFAVPISRVNVEPASGISTGSRTTEDFPVCEPNRSATTVSDVDETSMVDELEDHPFILSGDREIPFTYLASLSAKWAAVKDRVPNVKGKIKCFMTSVKEFQFRQTATYVLYVHVDDGSLISEILIDHNVVQKLIGHSPVEVTDALSSSDTKKVSDMRQTMKRFQFFLVNFEGMMLVQISEAFPCPVAIDMNQGCPPSDARLLLRRLQSSHSSQTQHQPHFEPINVSP